MVRSKGQEPNQRLKTLIATLPYVAMLTAFWPFQVDDAYISFVYTANLIAGRGLTYNGLLVEGYSNFLWTITLAPLFLLGVPALFAARILSMAAGLVTLAATARLCKRLGSAETTGGGWMAVLLLASCAPFAAWTLGGLETVWTAMWVTLACLLVVSPNLRRQALSVVPLLAAALSRPEGIIYFAVVLAYRLWRWTDEGLAGPKALTAWGLTFAVPYGLFLLWRYSTYGSILPNTALLKVSPSLVTPVQGLEWLGAFLALRPAFAILLLMGAAHLVRRRRELPKDWWLVVGLIGAQTAFILYVGPDWMPHHRFLVPVLPLLCALGALPRTTARKGLPALLLATLALTAAAWEGVLTWRLYRPLSVEFGRWTDGLAEAGRWIRETVPEEEWIAVVDGGALAYFSGKHTIDILGLNNPHIARDPDHSDPEYVLGFHPVLVQLHAKPLDSGERIPTDSKAGADLFYHPEFQQGYVLMPEPDPFWPTFYVRRDAVEWLEPP